MDVRKKFYVWNDKIQVMVPAYSPLDAAVQALSFYCEKYKLPLDSTEIPDSLISWENFTVDSAGFRHIDGTIVALHPNDIVVSAGNELVGEVCRADHLIDKDRVLDQFDELYMEYDPFCERDDFYRELGEDDE